MTKAVRGGGGGQGDDQSEGECEPERGDGDDVWYVLAAHGGRPSGERLRPSTCDGTCDGGTCEVATALAKLRRCQNANFSEAPAMLPACRVVPSLVEEPLDSRT